MGKLARAKDRRAILEATKQDTHTNMDQVTCLENLCLCLQSSAQHALANACLHDLLAIYAATYASDHEKVLRLQQAVAATYVAQKRFDEAYALYTHVIEATSAKHGRQHLAVAHAIEGLGRGYFLQGAYEMAEAAFKEARSILLQRLDAGNEELRRASNNLAAAPTTIQSDKLTMAGGGKAISTEAYHPNPNAVMDLDSGRTEL
ncbi:hypothetical protein SDRG_12913 [Saprolegnia diclina VS20]|uniref:MalT-like TPR region domain-containing protein n=1 Tax=Saprolegnia diclina (strain VS20) TaxID=1156394 RepID=T0Q4F3_SAPDV|nr:hypothetical protein SDRG_12913 [Saprolegnia diclina VS20]EQC29451.1 hypothetical protein SDRG_12913 [Saprolegnia diclina VS20]|eukprot:XP_008617218.1 hypothetical protein SDRG_12913 [Saprolegnia diclina VS20]